MDEEGYGLTLVDWITGMITGWGHVDPWSEFRGGLVRTERHNPQDFLKAAGHWQEQSLKRKEAVPPELVMER